MIDRIVTWQPVLTDHQSFTFASLAAVSQCTVEANVLHFEHPERVREGWRRTTGSGLVMVPHRGPLRALSVLLHAYRRRYDTHIFCSPWESPLLITCVLLCSLMQMRYAVVSEPYNPSDMPYFGSRPTLRSRVKRLLRPALYRLYGSFIRDTAKAVFAISDLAAEQYVQSGVPSSRIVPFGYFVPKMVEFKADRKRSGVIRAAFVGSISMRKGVDVLVQTWRILENLGCSISLDVYGSGDLRLLDGAPAAVKYRGRIEFGRVQEVLSGYDLAVLLGRHDGWGVVVNEALLSGVPVVCTSSVGASRLVRDYCAGIVLEKADPAAAADAINQLASDQEALCKYREGALSAGSRISPEQAAATIWQILKHEGA